MRVALCTESLISFKRSHDTELSFHVELTFLTTGSAKYREKTSISVATNFSKKSTIRLRMTVGGIDPIDRR